MDIRTEAQLDRIEKKLDLVLKGWLSEKNSLLPKILKIESQLIKDIRREIDKDYPKTNKENEK